MHWYVFFHLFLYYLIFVLLAKLRWSFDHIIMCSGTSGYCRIVAEEIGIAEECRVFENVGEFRPGMEYPVYERMTPQSRADLVTDLQNKGIPVLLMACQFAEACAAKVASVTFGIAGESCVDNFCAVKSNATEEEGDPLVMLLNLLQLAKRKGKY
jgi:hypothetical protein